MSKDFDGWNKKKKEIETAAGERFVNEGEIWWCSIGLNIGSEQDGKGDHFVRPVLVLKRFNKSVVLIVPLTTKPKSHPYQYHFIQNKINYSVIISQMRLVSTKRLRQRLLRIEENKFNYLIIVLINRLFN